LSFGTAAACHSFTASSEIPILSPYNGSNMLSTGATP